MEIKRNRYILRKFAVPTIFNVSKEAQPEIGEVVEPSKAESQIERSEEEILFLRKRIATLESDYDAMEKRLSGAMEQLKEENTRMKEKNTRLKEFVTNLQLKLDNDFVRFVLSDDPQVNITLELSIIVFVRICIREQNCKHIHVLSVGEISK